MIQVEFMLRFLMVLSFLVLITPNSYSQTSSCKEHQCIAVIDAGSTGSRLHIYAYDLDSTNSPINIKELWNKKASPGFANIEPESKAIDAYMTNLMAEAPKEEIPVYFYATAGMRLLPLTKQKKFYNELQSWFTQQSEWKLTKAKTITGNDEALYDWLSVNYHLGSLQSGANESIGVMDMGGASVQIVFPIQKNDTLNNKSRIELDLYGQHRTLYVQSFLGLGQTEVSHQYLNSASCFANNYPLPDGEYGQGNAFTCKSEIASLMNEVHKVNKNIQPLLAANPVDSWYSLGGITNMADSSLFNFANNQLTSQSLLQQADKQICNQQWDNLDIRFPNDDYVYQYCLFSAYYYALMVDGYGLNPEQIVNYIPPSQNIDWTLGVVLYH